MFRNSTTSPKTKGVGVIPLTVTMMTTSTATIAQTRRRTEEEKKEVFELDHTDDENLWESSAQTRESLLPVWVFIKIMISSCIQYSYQASFLWRQDDGPPLPPWTSLIPFSARFKIPSSKSCHWNIQIFICTHQLSTVRLTSIDHPPIGGKFTATPGGLTNLFYGCKD